MKRLIVMFAALLIVASVLPAQGRPGGPGRGPGPGFGAMSAWPGSRTPVTGAPYSAVQTTLVQQTLSNGNQIVRQETAKVYRDGQGRVRIEQTTTRAGSAQARTFITITDPVAKTSYELNPEAKTFVKMPARVFAGPSSAQAQSGSAFPAGRGRGQGQGQAAIAGRPQRGPQIAEEDLGSQTIEGIGATGKRSTQNIPAGEIGNQQAIQVVRETWVSTALHVPVMIKTSDPRFGTTSMQLSNVVMAEPDSALFQPPADYTSASRPQGGRNMMARRPPAN